MAKWTLIGMVVVIVIGVGIPAFAQEGGSLTPEQEALVERAVAARDKLNDVSGYVESAHGQSLYEIDVQTADSIEQISSLQVWYREATFVQVADEWTVDGLIALTVNRVEPDETQVTYSVDAEVRRVDGVWYIDAAYLDPDPALALVPLPDGWGMVDAVEDHPVYADLQLDDLIGAPDLFDMPDVILQAAADVVLGEEALDDGTTADTITITFDQGGMATVLREFGATNEVSPTVLEAMADAISEGSLMEIVVVLDAEDIPVRFSTTSLARALDVEGSAIGITGGDDSDVLLDIVIDNAREQVYSQVDDPALEPPETPEAAETSEATDTPEATETPE
jgi:hypothetical protein